MLVGLERDTMRMTMRVGVLVLIVGVVLAASAPPRVEAQTQNVALDTFDVDPYTHFNPPSNDDTIVNYPETAMPGAWRWRYIGYGTPASGDRNTTTVNEGAASWHFFLKQAANLDDPDTGSDDLTAAGPIIATRFRRSDWEPRSFDMIISDLSAPRIDWNQVVRFTVDVRAKWDTNSNLGTFSEIVQGLFIFGYEGGAVQNVNDFVFQSGDNDDAWHSASIEVLGQDTNNRFDIGVFGRVNFTPRDDRSLGDQSPALDFYFDNLRVLYTPLRLENVSATSPIDENDPTTLSGDIVYANAASGSFDVKVDWGDGSPMEIFTYPQGTTTFSETHQYLDDDPTGTPSDVYPVIVTLEDDEGSGMVETSVTVNNVPPSLSNLVAFSANGQDVFLNGKISDVGTLDTFTLQVDWGDGTTEPFMYPAGTSMFSESHTYADSSIKTIVVTLIDDDTGSTTAEVEIRWPNNVPVLSSLGLLLQCVVFGLLGAWMIARKVGGDVFRGERL